LSSPLVVCADFTLPEKVATESVAAESTDVIDNKTAPLLSAVL